MPDVSRLSINFAYLVISRFGRTNLCCCFLLFLLLLLLLFVCLFVCCCWFFVVVVVVFNASSYSLFPDFSQAGARKSD